MRQQPIFRKNCDSFAQYGGSSDGDEFQNVYASEFHNFLEKENSTEVVLIGCEAVLRRAAPFREPRGGRAAHGEKCSNALQEVFRLVLGKRLSPVGVVVSVWLDSCSSLCSLSANRRESREKASKILRSLHEGRPHLWRRAARRRAARTRERTLYEVGARLAARAAGNEFCKVSPAAA